MRRKSACGQANSLCRLCDCRRGEGVAGMRRNRRAGVGDRWTKTIRDEHGNTRTEQSASYGKGSRWRARYVDANGTEHAIGFGRKTDAQAWLDKQVSDQ